MNKLVFLGLACLLVCAPALADPCPSHGGTSTYSDLVCQAGPFTLEFGDISVNTNMQNPPAPQIFMPPHINYVFALGISDVGVLHPGEFFDIAIPITFETLPCCTIDFSTQIFQLQGCCVDLEFGPGGLFLNATNSGPSDLSWDIAWGIAQYTVPEPLTVGLLGAGLATAAALRGRRKL